MALNIGIENPMWMPRKGQIRPSLPEDDLLEKAVALFELSKSEERIYVEPGQKVPEGTALRQGSRGGSFYIPVGHEERPADAQVINHDDEWKTMQDVLVKLRTQPHKPGPITGDFSHQTINAMKDNADSYLGQYEKFFDAATYNKARNVAYMLINEGSKVKGKFNPDSLQALVNDSIDKMIYQEAVAWQTQMSDHGITHIYGNIDFTNRIFEALGEDGRKVKDEYKFMMDMVIVNHDIGYASKPVRENSIPESKKHKVYGRDWFNAERPLFSKCFSNEELDYMDYLILHHDDPVLDWDKMPLASALSVADNLSVFYKEKLPSLYRYVDGAIDTLFEMQKALQDKNQAGFDAAKKELEDDVDKTNLPDFTKGWLKRAANEVSERTPKFDLGLLIGKVSHFSFDRDSGLTVGVDEDPFDSRMADFFDVGQAQYAKLADEFGVKLENNDHIEFIKDNKTMLTININRAPEHNIQKGGLMEIEKELVLRRLEKERKATEVVKTTVVFDSKGRGKRYEDKKAPNPLDVKKDEEEERGSLYNAGMPGYAKIQTPEGRQTWVAHHEIRPTDKVLHYGEAIRLPQDRGDWREIEPIIARSEARGAPYVVPEPKPWGRAAELRQGKQKRGIVQRLRDRWLRKSADLTREVLEKALVLCELEKSDFGSSKPGPEAQMPTIQDISNPPEPVPELHDNDDVTGEKKDPGKNQMPEAEQEPDIYRSKVASVRPGEPVR